MHGKGRIRARPAEAFGSPVPGIFVRGVCANPRCQHRHGKAPGGEAVAARRAEGPACGHLACLVSEGGFSKNPSGIEPSRR